MRVSMIRIYFCLECQNTNETIRSFLVHLRLSLFFIENNLNYVIGNLYGDILFRNQNLFQIFYYDLSKC